MKPKFPLYIPSKGRYKTRLTSDALSSMGVDHYIIVEEKEFNLYKKEIGNNKFVTILILEKKYQAEYKTLDKLGNLKSKGPGAARNFAWQHSIDNGFSWHWVMDDNIRKFYRCIKNRQIKANSGGIFRAMEDFCLRYENVGMAGPNYFMFVPRKEKVPPFILNTRIYSCNLIRNDINYRWRGRYNEDTILSIDMLKDGWCTIQFNAFLQEKMRTQLLKGGNTEEFYAKEGTLPKSRMLVNTYPQYCKIVYKFKRIHHHCDYSIFKKNKLRRKKDVKIENKINNYGMELKKIK